MVFPSTALSGSTISESMPNVFTSIRAVWDNLTTTLPINNFKQVACPTTICRVSSALTVTMPSRMCIATREWSNGSVLVPTKLWRVPLKQNAPKRAKGMGTNTLLFTQLDKKLLVSSANLG
ncbi:unnamed protein product [Prorocentrum cordatum]|uniref:Uncharacterized protein n=1 Tax=Prorocentrum cordatum TaxID=2364126 RepID=A0ABN9WUR0_9DINO|nr:unnamed protein product [Polarella glacialis]